MSKTLMLEMPMLSLIREQVKELSLVAQPWIDCQRVSRKSEEALMMLLDFYNSKLRQLVLSRTPM